MFVVASQLVLGFWLVGVGLLVGGVSRVVGFEEGFELGGEGVQVGVIEIRVLQT